MICRRLGYFVWLLPCFASAAIADIQPANDTAAPVRQDKSGGQPLPGPQSTDNTPGGLWESDTLTGSWNGARSRLEAGGLSLGLQEQSEVWENLTGGLRRGVVYDGLTTASMKLNLEVLAGWTGATFFVNANQIHGRGPTANLAGNLQVVSDIEATRDTKLYQLWLEQRLLDGRLTIRIGQEGANDQMMFTQYGVLFFNSSFGFPGLPAADLPSGGPNYPMAAPFVRLQLQPTGQISLIGAAFTGDPAPPGTGDPQLRDRGGDAFRLNDHLLAFTELWYSINQDDNAAGLAGTYKLGAWYYPGSIAGQLHETVGVPLAGPPGPGVTQKHSAEFAVYAIADQMIWKKPATRRQGVGVFLQVMGTPNDVGLSNLFVETGMNWTGPFDERANDILGIGVSYLAISPASRRLGRDLVLSTGSGSSYRSNETVIEATYLFQATSWLTLQPDLQAIVNPGAGIPSSFSNKPLKNAFIAGLRGIVIF
jgi:porin